MLITMIAIIIYVIDLLLPGTILIALHILIDTILTINLLSIIITEPLINEETDALGEKIT